MKSIKMTEDRYWDATGVYDATLNKTQREVNAAQASATAAKYTKPAGGIPKTDLASGVQASLDKADTALQQHQSLAAYRTAAAQDAIDEAQDTAISAKYTKPGTGIPESDLASDAQSKIDNALPKTGDGSNVTAAFTAAANRTNISTGEKLSVIFGKIAKWFADLGSAAFRAATGSITQGSTDLVESGAVYTGLSGKYEKPAAGIPASDLAAAVQSSLDKADSAVEYTAQTLTDAQQSQARENIGAAGDELYNGTTLSGSTVSFTASSRMPIQQLVVRIDASQEGSGNPSPTNIRQFSGFDSASVVISPTLDAGDGNTIVYPFAAGAGTVYGGILTVYSDGTGELVVDRKLFTVTKAKLDSESDHGYFSDNGAYVRNLNLYENITQVKYYRTDTQGLAPCNASREVHVNNRGISNSRLYTSFLGPWTSYNEFYNAVVSLENNGTPMSYVAKLHENYTYKLSPLQVIQTLIGSNNIWANTGDISITYGGYLDTIQASIQNLIACIAPSENDNTASQSYAQGAFFFRSGDFCKAKTAIASGASFTLGTNYEVTTVAAALQALQ